MAKSVQELERIVMQLNRDLIEWQKFCCALRQHIEEFKTWTINELNRMKAGRPNVATPVAVEADERDEEMVRMRKRMKYMARDLDIIAANSMFPD
jgi:hypothetical protein